MEEYFQVGPHFFEALLARLLQNVLDEYQHPRGNAGQVGDVGMDGFACDSLHFGLEVLHQCRLLARHTDVVDQRVEVFHQDGREVAHQAMVGIQVGCVTSAQYQSLSRKEAALGILLQIQCHGVGASAVVRVFQRLAADRQELALVVCSAR